MLFSDEFFVKKIIREMHFTNWRVKQTTNMYSMNESDIISKHDVIVEPESCKGFCAAVLKLFWYGAVAFAAIIDGYI